MSQPKLNEVTHYSLEDRRLARFLALKAEVEARTAELELLKSEIKHRGTYSTEHFVATVSETTRKNPPSLTALVAHFGEAVLKLCTETTYSSVKVARKAGTP